MSPNKNQNNQTPIKESNTQSDSAISRSSSSQASSRKLDFKNSTPKTRSSDESEKDQEMRHSPIPRIAFSSSPDDDYFSSSSEEWASIRNQTENYKLVCNTVLELEGNDMIKDRGDFERIVLEKMDAIQQSVTKLEEDFSSLRNNTHTGDLVKHSNQVSEKRFDAEKVISKAIEELHRKLQTKQHSMLKSNEMKIKALIDDIQSTSRLHSAEINELCKQSIASIAKKLALAQKSNKNITTRTNKCPIDQGNSHSNDECFNYENICKVLSNHLQLTSDEKDYLLQENMEITMKYGESKQMLETQASLIHLLQNELNSMRTYIKKLNV